MAEIKVVLCHCKICLKGGNLLPQDEQLLDAEELCIHHTLLLCYLPTGSLHSSTMLLLLAGSGTLQALLRSLALNWPNITADQTGAFGDLKSGPLFCRMLAKGEQPCETIHGSLVLAAGNPRTNRVQLNCSILLTLTLYPALTLRGGPNIKLLYKVDSQS